MRVFRRLQALGYGVEVQQAAVPHRDPAEPTGLRAHQDTGPILVAVDGGPRGWDALEWAAAEAAARQCALRIVYAVNWSHLTLAVLDGISINPGYVAVYEAAEVVLDEATSRARLVAPALRITSHVQEGSTTTAILREAHRGSLIVLGRGRTVGRFSFTMSVNWRIARRAKCPVAIVGLFGEGVSHLPAVQVVVSVDGAKEPTTVFDYAFRAALRRGVGITVLQPSMQHGTISVDARVEDPPGAECFKRRTIDAALQKCQDLFPDVQVRQRFVKGSDGQALVAESAGAALVVLGGRARGRLHRAFSGSVEHITLRTSSGPVVIVGCDGGVEDSA